MLQVLVRDRIERNPEFLGFLLDDPHAAITEVLGVFVPPSVEIVLHEQTQTQINLVLPYRAPHLKHDEPSDQLSEEDLESVGGGVGWFFNASGELLGGQFVL